MVYHSVNLCYCLKRIHQLVLVHYWFPGILPFPNLKTRMP
uniref:Uncharacterized protein n=1 Tax=Anguilla anguilla TaxID=7936 RepID=A0A0E9U1F5_ANGAN